MANHMNTINVDGQVVPIDNSLSNDFDEDAMSYIQTGESGIDEQIADDSTLIQTASNQEKLQRIMRQSH